MNTIFGSRRAVVFLCLAALSACGSTGGEKNLLYPPIHPRELKVELTGCDGVDRYIRQTDSIRWSMREDGAELETEFVHMVQMSVATAAAIAIAVPLVSVGYYDPTLMILPYAAAYSPADSLQQIDALVIALLAKRDKLQCPPHPDCVITDDATDTLTALREVREQVESGEIRETEGLKRLTTLLDNLCPVGNRYIHSE